MLTPTHNVIDIVGTKITLDRNACGYFWVPVSSPRHVAHSGGNPYDTAFKVDRSANSGDMYRVATSRCAPDFFSHWALIHVRPDGKWRIVDQDRRGWDRYFSVSISTGYAAKEFTSKLVTHAKRALVCPHMRKDIIRNMYFDVFSELRYYMLPAEYRRSIRTYFDAYMKLIEDGATHAYFINSKFYHSFSQVAQLHNTGNEVSSRLCAMYSSDCRVVDSVATIYGAPVTAQDLVFPETGNVADEERFVKEVNALYTEYLKNVAFEEKIRGEESTFWQRIAELKKRYQD